METKPKWRYGLVRRYGRAGLEGKETLGWFVNEAEATKDMSTRASLDEGKKAMTVAYAAFVEDYLLRVPKPRDAPNDYEATNPPPAWRGAGERAARQTRAEWLAEMGSALRGRHASISAWERRFAVAREDFLAGKFGVDLKGFMALPGFADTVSYEILSIERDEVYDDVSDWFERFA